MKPKHENISQPNEDQSQAAHPLDDMPDFGAYREQVNGNGNGVEYGQANRQETRAEQLKDNPRSDAVLDRLFDKIGCDKSEGYFERPEDLADFTHNAINRTYEEAVHNFTEQVEEYRANPHRTKEYKKLAEDFYKEIGNNVQDLRRKGLVGDDAINVFLDQNCVSNLRGVRIEQYDSIQADYSRKEGNNLLTGEETYWKYIKSGKDLANYFAENNGDIAYQSEWSGEGRNYYTPESEYYGGTFMHVNAEKPREGEELRCYISADKTKDPSLVLDAWRESMENSPLKDQLYFKFLTTINPKDEQVQRPDDIVIYKYDNIDDQAFKELLQDFQKRCNDVSPDLLANDDAKMPVTTEKIANGISISAEPVFVNKMLRYTDHKDGKHSWTTFIDKMSYLSISVAANRLGVRPDSFDEPGLRDETKKVFREFMLLSKINPDTMLPMEYGNELPEWAKLNETPDVNSQANEQATHNNETLSTEQTVPGRNPERTEEPIRNKIEAETKTKVEPAIETYNIPNYDDYSQDAGLFPEGHTPEDVAAAWGQTMAKRNNEQETEPEVTRENEREAEPTMAERNNQEQFEQTLNTTREQLFETWRICESNDVISTNLQNQLRAILDVATYNLDDINQIMDGLYRVEEELSQAMMQFDQISNTYGDYMAQGQQYLDETWYRSERQYLDENARMFDAMCKRFLDMEDLLG